MYGETQTNFRRVVVRIILRKRLNGQFVRYEFNIDQILRRPMCVTYLISSRDPLNDIVSVFPTGSV